MRTLIAPICLVFSSALMLSGDTSILQSGTNKDLAQVEAHRALSSSYAQVLVTVTNSQNSPIFIPICSNDSYEICSYFAHLEQRQDKDPSVWQRTHTEPMVGGDVILPSRVLRLGKGESCGCVFRFHPGVPLLPNGSHLKYPGKVRVVIQVWQDEKSTTDPGKAVELATQEFEIPPPPETWGPQSTR